VACARSAISCSQVCGVRCRDQVIAELGRAVEELRAEVTDLRRRPGRNSRSSSITARRVQHDLRQARCGCGTVHAAARPDGVPGSAVSIGPNLRALAVYLVAFQHVPVERSTWLIADATGAQVSELASRNQAWGSRTTSS